MRRTVLAIALLAVVVTAGCAGPADDAPTATATQIPERATTATATATEELPTTRATTTTATTATLPDTDDEPEKGDRFLSAVEIDESHAMAANATERIGFENLSAERQQVVQKAVECGCNVALDGEFSFHDDDRIEVVEYEETYYFRRVAIV